MISDFLVRYFNVTILIMLSSIFGPIRSVLLGRMLTINDFGTYSLALTVIGFLYPLLMFGQQRGIIRFFNRHNVKEYNWIKPILILIGVAIFVGIILINFISLFYNTDNSFIYFCLFAFICSITAELLAFIVISSGSHEIGLIIQRSIRVIITLCVIGFFFSKISSLVMVFYTLGSIHILYALTVYRYVIKKVEIGVKRFPISARKEGLFFSILDVVLITNSYGINFIIGAILSINHLGAFYALCIILRVYDAFIQATDFVVMPSARILDKRGLIVITSKNFLIGLIISASFILVGEPLLSALYLGKFDSYLFLIRFICVLGWLKIMDIIPSSIIGGMSNTKVLKRYTFLNVGLSIISLPFSIYLIYNYELIGAVISLILLTLIRAVFGFGILLSTFRFIK